MHGGAGLRRGRRTPVVELPAGAVRAVVVAAVRAGLACGPKPSPLEHHAREDRTPRWDFLEGDIPTEPNHKRTRLA